MRALVILTMVAAYAVAVAYQGSLVVLLLRAYGPIAQIMPVLVAALYWKRATGIGALAGLLGGSAVTTAFVVWPELRPLPIHAGLFGLVVNVALLVGVSLATRPGEGGAAFVDDARGR